MFNLDKDQAPRWLELPRGVKVQVRPLDDLVAVAAQNAGLSRFQRERVEAEAAAAAGTPLDPKGLNVTNPDYVDALFAIETAQALGRFGIQQWEGVVGADGQPLPCTPDAAARFASHPVMRLEFVAKYNRTLDEATTEGNGSAPSPRGATDEGSTTAEAAKEAETPPDAPEGQAGDAGGAQSSSTGRGRQKAKRA